MTPVSPPAKSHRSAAARRRGRAPGRPAGEGGDLRERLLDAAIACFARQGIAGSSLRGIASEAGATPALLHYYFGGVDAPKDALMAAVIEERLMPVMQSLRDPLSHAGDDPKALIRGFVRTMIATALAHPWLPQLWVREVLHEGGGLRRLMFERIGPLFPRAVAERFARAQAQGRLNPRLDPRLLMPSLIGQTMFMAASAPIWRGVFDAGDVDADALCDHVLALLESGLELRDV
ncbi:MAG: TetR/AcrR family transcriptional regulator [Lysobacteraceae bacterium]